MMILLKNISFANVFAFLQLSGEFEHVKIRIAPKQEKPYSTLLDVAQHQPEFTAENISGTIIGYYAPRNFLADYGSGLAPFIFISDDRQFAGHLLAF